MYMPYAYVSVHVCDLISTVKMITVNKKHIFKGVIAKSQEEKRTRMPTK